jgi:hypothetical protein
VCVLHRQQVYGYIAYIVISFRRGDLYILVSILWSSSQRGVWGSMLSYLFHMYVLLDKIIFLNHVLPVTIRHLISDTCVC